jgi:hypothetical protein
MAWTTPMTFVDGAPLTAAQLNTYLRDNMNETEVAKATTMGGLFIAEGANKIVERFGGSSTVDDQEDTTSTTFTDLETVGPTVTCNTGTRALYFVSCQIANTNANQSGHVGIQISGATNVATFSALQIDGIAADKANMFGTCGFWDDLVPGENTFKLQYLFTNGLKGSFANRSLTIIPF